MIQTTIPDEPGKATEIWKGGRCFADTAAAIAVYHHGVEAAASGAAHVCHGVIADHELAVYGRTADTEHCFVDAAVGLLDTDHR